MPGRILPFVAVVLAVALAIGVLGLASMEVAFGNRQARDATVDLGPP